MEGLILCRGKLAVNPFYAGDISFYSIEEICYYLYENIYTISEDFFSERLIEFIRSELEEEEIGAALAVLLKNGLRLKEAVLTVLMNVDFYSAEEVTKLRNVVEELDKLEPYERVKACGDTMLKAKRYMKALEDYGKAAVLAQKQDAPQKFFAKLYHDKGVAYGRMLLYELAYEAFSISYQMSGDEETRMQMVAADILGELKHEGILEEEKESVMHSIESAMNHAMVEPICKKVNDSLAKRNSGNYSDYVKDCDVIVESFKKDCLNNMR